MRLVTKYQLSKNIIRKRPNFVMFWGARWGRVPLSRKTVENMNSIFENANFFVRKNAFLISRLIELDVWSTSFVKEVRILSGQGILNPRGSVPILLRLAREFWTPDEVSQFCYFLGSSVGESYPQPKTDEKMRIGRSVTILLCSAELGGGELHSAEKGSKK